MCDAEYVYAEIYGHFEEKAEKQQAHLTLITRHRLTRINTPMY
jgi:hypothetical protein